MAEKVIIDIEIDGTKSIDTMNKLNEEIKTQKKLLNDAKIGSEEYVNANEAINKLTKAHKELTTELTKEEKIRQRQAAAMEKEAQKMQELIKAASMEVKSEEDMIKKKNALVALRKKVDQTTEEGAKKYREMGNEILELNNQLIKNDEAINMHQRKVGNYTGAIETVNMSLGEMKRALRELRNVSFADKTEEEVIALREQMARLTEGIRDFQEQNAAASESGIPAFVAGLQGIVASVQLVTGTLASFGIENERLEKSMVQLIGVAQALATVEDIYARGKFKVMLTTIKDTAAKVANAVAAKGQALATTGATAATRALGKAMMSNPYTAIAAAAAAAVTAIVLLVKYIKTQTSEMLEQSKMIKELKGIRDNYTASLEVERQTMNNLFEQIKKTNVGTNERRVLVDELNRNYKDYLPSLDLEKATLEQLVVAQKASNVELQNKIAIQAQDKAMSDVITKMTELKIKEMEATQKLARAEKNRDDAMKTGGETQLSYIQIYDQAKNELDAITFSLQAQEQQLINIQTYFRDQIVLTQQSTAATQTNTAAVQSSTNIYNEFNNSLKQINEEYEFASYFAKNRIEQWDAEKKRITDLITEYQNFLAADGWTEAELEKFAAYKAQLTTDLETVKTQLFEFNTQVNEMLALNPMQILPSKEQLEKQLEETKATINAGMSAWQSARNEEEKARQQDIKDEAAAWEERRQIAESTAVEFGNIIASSIDETGFSLEKFGKMYTQFILDQMQKVVYAAIAEITAREFATKGLAGAVTAGLINASVVAAFQVAKSLVARSGSFAEGGFTGHGGKYEPAGTVHKGEVVFSQADVAALGGAQTVDAMRPTSKQNYYVGGIVGSVPQPVNSSAMLLDAIRQIRPIVTVQDINAVAQAEANRQQIAVI